MPDSVAGGFASLNGNEITNDARTIAYARNLGLPFTIKDGCWCPNIQELTGCESPTGYSTPAEDIAPWFDDAIPESADFAGFLSVEFTGLGSTYTRTATEILVGGSALGRLRPKARSLRWRGFLLGRNACAVMYGLRWLTSTLAEGTGCDGCGEADLDVLYCCPDPEECLEEECPTDIPAQGLVLNNDAFRTFYKVGLSEGPTILSERKVGCGGDCRNDNCPSTTLIEIEFTLLAGNPYMHRQPVAVCSDGQFPDCDDCSDWFVKLTDSEECVIEPTECPTGDDDFLEDEFCPSPAVPVIPPFIDPCACDILVPTTWCCSISKDIAGQYFETVPIIEIFSGSKPLRNIEIRFVENPQERECCDLATEPCFFCESLRIRYIPANTTITIDGTNKRIMATGPANNIQPAEQLTLSPFSWPTLKCLDYCVCLVTDCIQDIATDHFINISVVPREM